MSVRLAAIVAASAIILTGCSNAEPEHPQATEGAAVETTEAPQQTEESEAGGPEEWAVDYYGAHATFTLPPSEETESDLGQRVIDYRERAGIEFPVYFIDIHVDNTSGSEPISISEMTIVTDEGGQYSGGEDTVQDAISEAQDEAGDDTDLYNEGVDLYNETLDEVMPGAKRSILVGFWDNYPNPKNVTIVFSGGVDYTEAYPNQ